MDSICVTKEALLKAVEELRNLNFESSRISTALISECNSAMSNIDEGLQSDIQSYVSLVERFNNSIKTYSDENISALEERIRKMERYANL